MTRAERWLRDLVERYETRPWGAGTLVLFVAALIAVRNLLEIAVGRNPVFEALAAFVHYPLAYVAPFLALTLVLALWAGVAPVRVARLMSLAWLLTLLPPVADYLLHSGAEKPTIGYLQAHPAELGTVWLRFFDPTFSLRGTTPGIRVETFAAVVLGAVYVFLRSGRAWRAAGAAATIYITSLFFFSLPLLVTRIFGALAPTTTLDSLLYGQGLFLRPDRDSSPDSAGVLWLGPVLLALAALWTLAERAHAGERIFPAAPRRPLVPGGALFLAPVALAGVAAAFWFHIPLNQPLVVAPYDVLATLGLVLATGALVAATGWIAEGCPERALLCAGFGVVTCAALGRSVTVGLCAAVAPLVPLALRIVPDAWRRIVLVPALALAALGAQGAGYALVIGSEAIARMPHAVTAAPILAGAAFAIAGLRPRGPGLVAGACFTAVFAVAGLVLGQPSLLAVGIPFGVGVALVAWGAGFVTTPERAFAVCGAALGLAVLAFTYGALATEAVREPFGRTARCVSRLDAARGERLAAKSDWPAASNAFRGALQCDPNYTPALRGLGLGLIRFDNRLDRGIEFLERAVKTAPESVVDLSNLAAAYLRAKRSAEALALAEKAVALDPADVAALANRAQALDDLGRGTDALAAWRAYLDRAQARPEEAQTVRIAQQRLRGVPAGP